MNHDDEVELLRLTEEDLNARAARSQDCATLLRMMQDEYVATGYMYSGCLAVGYIVGKLEWSACYAIDVVYDLIDAGHVRKRDCQAIAFELSTEQRRTLFEKYNLADKWWHERGVSRDDISVQQEMKEIEVAR